MRDAEGTDEYQQCQPGLDASSDESREANSNR